MNLDYMQSCLITNNFFQGWKGPEIFIYIYNFRNYRIYIALEVIKGFLVAPFDLKIFVNAEAIRNENIWGKQGRKKEKAKKTKYE